MTLETGSSIKHREILGSAPVVDVFVAAEPRRVYEELVNELEGTEMETKLAIGDDTRNEEVMNTAFEYFQTQPDYALYEPNIIHASNVVIKYATPKGGFSILFREDGTHALKKKGEKIFLTSGTILRPEDKAEIPIETDPLDEASSRYDIPRDQMALLGAYERKKARVLVINQASGRVYTINADESTMLDPQNTQIKLAGSPLRQLEIEYKGTLPGRTSKADDKTQVVQAIHDEVSGLQTRMIASSKQRGLSLEPTKLTKRQWMKAFMK